MDRVEGAWLAYSALERRDLDAFLQLVDRDVEFRSLIAEAEGRDYRGHEGVREWWEAVAGSMGGLRFEPKTVREIGEGICAEIEVFAVVEGVELSQRMWQVARFRGDKIRSWRVVRSEAEARAWLAGGEVG